jgi:hypothetical protein
MMGRTYACAAACAMATLTGVTVPCAVAADAGGGSDEVVARWDFDDAAAVQQWKAAQGVRTLGVRDGVWRLALTEADAYIFAPAVSVPLGGCAVRVRMRSDVAGRTEVYWGTRATPDLSEARVIRQWTPATDDFITVEFDLPSTGPDDVLTQFRIDPYNNNVEGTVELDWVELVRRAPQVQVEFYATPTCTEGDETTVKLVVRQSGGRVERCAVHVQIGDETPHEATLDSEHRSLTFAQAVPLGAVGGHRFRAKATAGAYAYDLTAYACRLPRGDGPVGEPILRTDSLLIEPIPDAVAPDCVVGLRLWAADGQGGWKEAAILPTLVELRAIGGVPPFETTLAPSFNALPLGDGEVDLRAYGAAAGLTKPWGSFMCELQLASERIVDTLVLRVWSEVRWNPYSREGSPIGVAKFGLPPAIVRAAGGDPADRVAVFGGLEYLGPGEVSSSADVIGEKFAARWTPAPHKITLPLMAIEANGLATGVLWQPRQAWQGEFEMPAATFASPDRLRDQPVHRMEVFAPGVGQGLAENAPYAHNAVELGHDQAMRLEYVLAAECGATVLDMARCWYDVFGVPDPPPAPHSDEETYELCIRNYGETMYWPGQRGWRMHWFRGDEKPRFIPWMAGELISHAARTGQTRWVERTGVAGRSIVDMLGPLRKRLDTPPVVRQMIASQQADGTWPYTNSAEVIEKTKQLTKGRYETLGKDGSTTLGTTVQNAHRLLTYAVITGDEPARDAGLRALEAMKRFHVPRGAQVWEVPLMVPDIRAAALAVEANQVGYRLTGDESWLDEAQRWAWAGVPFVYAWEVPTEGKKAHLFLSRNKQTFKPMQGARASIGFEDPDRQVTPYATIPVFGTTFYVIGWFGNVVQWCGLEWASKVQDLLEDRPDPVLGQIANGVLLSGRQQMLDRPPWVGLYPDVWELETNCGTGAYISSMLILRVLQAQGVAPRDTLTWSRVLHEQGGPVHVSGWGRLVAIERDADQLRLTVDFAPGQDNELLIVGVPAPQEVVRSAGEQGAGRVDPVSFDYIAAKRTVYVRYRHELNPTTLGVRW